MELLKSHLGQMLEAFELAAAIHEDTLIELKSAALITKNRCEELLAGMAHDYQQSADTVQAQINYERQIVGELRPIIDEIRQLKENGTAGQQPAKQRTRKAGRA